MILTGIGDEGASSIDGQIQAAQELGWKQIEMRGVEVPGFPKANLHEIPDAAFDIVVRKLEEAGIGVYAFGSTVMNWGKTIETPFDVTLGEVKRAIPRMKRLGTRFIRVMSFKPGDEDDAIPSIVFERVAEVTKMFLDEGLQPVHENCMNYGGMSSKHALEILDKAPGLKWVFDTANPIFNADRSKAKPWPKQDPWEFWTQLRDHTAHIHIKDATWNPTKNDADYNWPGEGQGRVRDILKDAFARGYDAGISIEPHMVVVFHDANSEANEDAMRTNYVEYGRRLMRLIDEIKSPGTSASS
ncbi:MAG: sugar phosphate isomerase/epimerase [Verrucomicrobia bacterium]|nr:sugar phosphate isomerase/epimerase [Verrucomicrobiota bacterium]